MKFRKDNKIRYRQDFRSFIGIPSGVDLTIVNQSGMFKLKDSFMLIGDGHGEMMGNYGNGAIYVCKKSLTKKQLDRFERVIKDQSCH
jgi:hypothetical protein